MPFYTLSASTDTSVPHAKPYIAVVSSFLFASVARVTRYGCIHQLLPQCVNLIAVNLGVEERATIIEELATPRSF